MDFGNKIKYFNYRSLVSIWLFMMMGVIFAVGLHVNSMIYFVLSLVMFTIFCSTLIIKLIIAKKYKVFKILSVIICFLLSACFTSLILFNYDSAENLKGEYYVNGRIYSYTSRTASGLKVVSLENVLIKNTKTGEIEKLDCKVCLYLEESDGRTKEFNPGDLVEGVVDLKRSEYLRDGELNFYLNNKNIDVLGFGNEEDVEFTGKTKKFIFDKIKIKVKSVLTSSISEEFGELGFAMFFGDKSGLEEHLSNSYSESGIGHLLAVSGLHVGFVVTLLSLFLALFKLNDKAKFCIISIAVFMYAFMCGFSVSVTRALIMTVVLLFSKLRKQKYDSLSSLAFAGIIVLLWNPLFVFDVGYILSFSTVASIILFSHFFTVFFSKFLNNKFASALSISLSASIGTTFTMMICFEKLSILSVVINMIAIPVASVAFMMMFLFVLIALIIPPLGALLYAFEFLMKIVTGMSQIFGSISLVGMSKYAVYSFGASLTMASILMSDYALINKKNKITFVSLSLTIMLVSGVIMFIC